VRRVCPSRSPRSSGYRSALTSRTVGLEPPGGQVPVQCSAPTDPFRSIPPISQANSGQAPVGCAARTSHPRSPWPSLASACAHSQHICFTAGRPSDRSAAFHAGRLAQPLGLGRGCAAPGSCRSAVRHGLRPGGLRLQPAPAHEPIALQVRHTCPECPRTFHVRSGGAQPLRHCVNVLPPVGRCAGVIPRTKARWLRASRSYDFASRKNCCSWVPSLLHCAHISAERRCRRIRCRPICGL